MRPSFLPLVLSLLLPPLFSGCGSVRNLSAKRAEKQRREALMKLTETSVKEASARLGEKAVGAVTYADDVNGFVLVKARAGATLAQGTKLEIRRGGAAVAEVAVSPETRPPFIAADILSGTPARGDIAFPLAGSHPAAKLVPVPGNGASSPASPATAETAAPGNPPPSAESSASPELPPLEGLDRVEAPAGEAVRIQKPEDIIRERAAFPQGAPPPSAPPAR